MNSTKRFYNYRLRGTDQQIGDELIARGVRYSNLAPQPSFGPGTPVAPPDALRGTVANYGSMAIVGYTLQQRSGSADLSVGVGFRLRNDQWKAGQWTDAAGTPYTDDTYDAQDQGASDFPTAVVGTANDGFVIASRVPFNWVSMNVGTASVGAETVAVRYSNLAGTGWTAVGTNQTYVDNFTRTTVLATGEQLFVWDPPLNWGRVTSLSGIPDGYYALNVRSTTAPATTAAVATAIEIGTLIAVEDVDDNGLLSEEVCYHWEPFGDGIVAFFSTLNIGNSAKVQWVHA